MKELAKIEAQEATIQNPNDIDSMFGGHKEENGCSASKLVIQNNITAIHQENEGVCQDQYDMGF